MAKRRALIKQANCVACGSCVKQCPREAIEIWKGCYAVVDGEKCIGCGLCSKECPANAIELIERKQEGADGSNEK